MCEGKCKDCQVNQEGILKFNLEDPDASMAFIRATKALDLTLVLWDISQDILRKMNKYGIPEGMTADQLLEQITDDFYAILSKRGINLDEILN